MKTISDLTPKLESTSIEVKKYLDKKLTGQVRELWDASRHYVNAGGKMMRPFIVQTAYGLFKDNPGLDYKGDSPAEYGYAVFGKVIDGMDTVEKIKGVQTTTKEPYQNVPVKPVIIKSMRRVSSAELEEE